MTITQDTTTEREAILARIGSTTAEIDEHKTAIDRLMTERHALFLAARADGVTLKQIAAAAKITEMAVSLSVRTNRK